MRGFSSRFLDNQPENCCSKFSCSKAHLIDFMFHGSGGSDFCSLQKKVGALLRMRTSTNLLRRDAALLEEEN